MTSIFDTGLRSDIAELVIRYADDLNQATVLLEKLVDRVLELEERMDQLEARDAD